jgi:tryptophan synthase alpha chain
MRIGKTLSHLKEQKEKGLIIYITAGDPSLEATEELVVALAEAGADVVELGIPFSDPLADGVTIQQATQRALKNKVNIPKILTSIKRIRERTSLPLALMGYYNPMYHYGLESLVDDSKEAGVDGFIVPDLPFEEAEFFQEITERAGLELISFLAPTSTRERIAAITKRARGFIYCVSVTGVTGMRKEFSSKVKEKLESIRDYTDLPLAIGFGISTPEQAQEAAEYADAVIVGSAVVHLIEEAEGDLAKMIPAVSHFVRSLKEAITESKG